MQKRRQFRVDPLKNDHIHYEALVDKHLEYFFASKFNRKSLLKTKIVNRKNEIIDRDICKAIQNDNIRIHNSFRLKPFQNRRYSSVKSRQQSMGKTVGKKQFEDFLQKQRNQIKNNNFIGSTDNGKGNNRLYESNGFKKQELTI